MDSSTLDDIEVKRNLESSKVCCIDEDEAVKLENKEPTGCLKTKSGTAGAKSTLRGAISIAWVPE